MSSTMLLATLVSGLLLLALFVAVARRFQPRHVQLRRDPDRDPLLARPERPEGVTQVVSRRIAAGTVLLGLAITTLAITLGVGAGQRVIWAVLTVGLLYAAVVFLMTARVRGAGPT